MQHFRDIQLVRTVEVCTPYGWCNLLFVSLKQGDIFRLTESRVGERDDKKMPGVWRALSDAKPVLHQGLSTISIDCEPYEEGQERKFGDT